jgi:hypothetical protein
MVQRQFSEIALELVQAFALWPIAGEALIFF